jgi:hypothetical protein
MKAIEQGIALKKMTREELYKTSEKIITESRATIDTLMKTGMIPPPPKGV